MPRDNGAPHSAFRRVLLEKPTLSGTSVAFPTQGGNMVASVRSDTGLLVYPALISIELALAGVSGGDGFQLNRSGGDREGRLRSPLSFCADASARPIHSRYFPLDACRISSCIGGAK